MKKILLFFSLLLMLIPVSAGSIHTALPVKAFYFLPMSEIPGSFTPLLDQLDGHLHKYGVNYYYNAPFPAINPQAVITVCKGYKYIKIKKKGRIIKKKVRKCNYDNWDKMISATNKRKKTDYLIKAGSGKWKWSRTLKKNAIIQGKKKAIFTGGRPRLTSRKAILKNIRFIKNIGDGLDIAGGPNQHIRLEGCQFLANGTYSAKDHKKYKTRSTGRKSGNGLTVNSSGLIEVFYSRAAANRYDGFNFHSPHRGVGIVIANHLKASKNGKWGESNNDITAHDGIYLADVNSIYKGSANRTFHNIQGVKSISIGSLYSKQFRNTIQKGSRTYLPASVSATGGAEMLLYDCTILGRKWAAYGGEIRELTLY